MYEPEPAPTMNLKALYPMHTSRRARSFRGAAKRLAHVAVRRHRRAAVIEGLEELGPSTLDETGFEPRYVGVAEEADRRRELLALYDCGQGRWLEKRADRAEGNYWAAVEAGTHSEAELAELLAVSNAAYETCRAYYADFYG